MWPYSIFRVRITKFFQAAGHCHTINWTRRVSYQQIHNIIINLEVCQSVFFITDSFVKVTLIKINIINSFNSAKQQNCVRPSTKTLSTKQAVRHTHYTWRVRCVGNCVIWRCYKLGSSYRVGFVQQFYWFTLQFGELDLFETLMSSK